LEIAGAAAEPAHKPANTTSSNAPIAGAAFRLPSRRGSKVNALASSTALPAPTTTSAR